MSISRRDFMSLVGGSVAGAAAVAAGSRLASSGAAVSGSKADWRVDSIGQPNRGAQPITLVNRVNGDQLRVELCRRGSRHAPVARSRNFDLFLANGGNGNAHTSREQVQVVQGLARKLDSHFEGVPAGVLSMEERQSKHPELFETSDDIVSA